jgi:hypothetical protein
VELAASLRGRYRVPGYGDTGSTPFFPAQPAWRLRARVHVVCASALAVLPLITAIVAIATTFLLLLGLTELTTVTSSCVPDRAGWT